MHTFIPVSRSSSMKRRLPTPTRGSSSNALASRRSMPETQVDEDLLATVLRVYMANKLHKTTQQFRVQSRGGAAHAGSEHAYARAAVESAPVRAAQRAASSAEEPRIQRLLSTENPAYGFGAALSALAHDELHREGANEEAIGTSQTKSTIMSGAAAPTRVFFSRNIPYALDKFKQSLGSLSASRGLVEIAHFAEVEQNIPRAELLNQVKGCTGLLCLLTDRIDAELLDAAGPSLRVVSTVSVGYNHIDVAACKARNVQIGHTPGVLDISTAETAVALTFAAKRRLLECADSARSGGWGVWHPFQYGGTDIRGCTVGVIGLGRIGTTYARMMKYGFNCKIVYSGPSPKPEMEAELGGDVEYLDLESLLRQSDIVSVHMPLNASTRGSMDARCFSLMKPSAVFINTSRGEVVDQDALVDALREQRIAAAGLDVTTPEPLPPSDALFGLSNCVVLPHIGSATMKTRQAMVDIAVRNLVAGVEGKELPHGVV